MCRSRLPALSRSQPASCKRFSSGSTRSRYLTPCTSRSRITCSLSPAIFALPKRPRNQPLSSCANGVPNRIGAGAIKNWIDYDATRLLTEEHYFAIPHSGTVWILVFADEADLQSRVWDDD